MIFYYCKRPLMKRRNCLWTACVRRFANFEEFVNAFEKQRNRPVQNYVPVSNLIWLKRVPLHHSHCGLAVVIFAVSNLVLELCIILCYFSYYYTNFMSWDELCLYIKRKKNLFIMRFENVVSKNPRIRLT